jgi:hypothetical protein
MADSCKHGHKHTVFIKGVECFDQTKDYQILEENSAQKSDYLYTSPYGDAIKNDGTVVACSTHGEINVYK